MTTISSDLIRLYDESDALRLAELVRKGEVSPLELTELAISLIEQLNPKLNAVVIKTFELAREMAASVPRDGIFAGVPFLLKDIGSMWAGTRMTAGMAYRKDVVCSYDSEIVRRIKAAGFVLLGRTNVPENGWCIATESKLHGPAINPWNEAVTPGGSSGGAAVAVASRMVPLAEGTDGGGSIRVPASCCGLVGLKPSRGRISYGPEIVDIWFGSVYFFALTRTVRDTAAYLDVTAGNLPGDPYILSPPEKSWLANLQDRPRPLRVGFTMTTPWGPAFAPEVAKAVLDTAKLLEEMGHIVERHDFESDLESAWHSYNQMNAVQTVLDFEQLARVVGRPVMESDLVAFNWSLLQRGRSLSATEHADSIRVIRDANRQIQMELAPYDVYLTPTLTQPPRPVGYWDMNEPDFDAYNAKWTDAAFMFAFNLSGLPAMSVPAAWIEQNVPIGVQLVGRYGDEATILRVARQIEEARPWIDRRPAYTTTLPALPR
jgi:amidase